MNLLKTFAPRENKVFQQKMICALVYKITLKIIIARLIQDGIILSVSPAQGLLPQD